MSLGFALIAPCANADWTPTWNDPVIVSSAGTWRVTEASDTGKAEAWWPDTVGGGSHSYVTYRISVTYFAPAGSGQLRVMPLATLSGNAGSGGSASSSASCSTFSYSKDTSVDNPYYVDSYGNQLHVDLNSPGTYTETMDLTANAWATCDSYASTLGWFTDGVPPGGGN